MSSITLSNKMIIPTLLILMSIILVLNGEISLGEMNSTEIERLAYKISLFMNNNDQLASKISSYISGSDQLADNIALQIKQQQINAEMDKQKAIENTQKAKDIAEAIKWQNFKDDSHVFLLGVFLTLSVMILYKIYQCRRKILARMEQDTKSTV